MCESGWRTPVHLDPRVREQLMEKPDWVRAISADVATPARPGTNAER